MASNRNTVIRSLHDLGAAAWFGGNPDGGRRGQRRLQGRQGSSRRAAVASAGWARWARWAPVNAAAIGAHVVGSIGIFLANRDRVRNQPGAAANSVITVAALGTTVYSGILVGAIIICGAQQGEQQLASEQLRTRGLSAVKDAASRVPKLAA